MKAAQLHGLWAVRFTHPPAGLPERATMLLERHAEFSESLAGIVSRELGAAEGSKAIAGHASKALLAGDLDEGLLLLDESSDHVSITGTWNGEMVQGSCGKVYQGHWKDTRVCFRLSLIALTYGCILMRNALAVISNASGLSHCLAP